MLFFYVYDVIGNKFATFETISIGAKLLVSTLLHRQLIGKYQMNM